jgi:hypothetical protein
LNYTPEDSQITIDIESFEKGENRHLLQYEGRFQSYIFVLKPKTIHALFNKYRFNLFFKNVRNPLKKSIYNEKIVETLLKQPDSFWYFNNGITGITSQMPTIGKNAKKFTIEGLQVINGAQTVYSIYEAYEKASPAQRKMMDTDARVSFRLIRSSDERFNQEITRYTNSQNQILDRDFVANDDIQQRLQDESFQTNFWYEKRRDEFRLTEEEQEKKGIKVVSNEVFIKAYFAFHLQKPLKALAYEDKFFVKRTNDADGLYEEIFAQNIKFEDMLSSYLIWGKLQISYGEIASEIMQNLVDIVESFLYVGLGLFRVHLKKFLQNKIGTEANLSLYIIQAFQHDNKKMKNMNTAIDLFLKFVINFMIKNKDNNSYILKLLSSQTQYDILCQQIEDMSEEEFMKLFAVVGKEGGEQA